MVDRSGTVLENVAIVIPTKIIDSNLASLLDHLLKKTSVEIVVVKTDECSVEGSLRFRREPQITLVTAQASRGGQIRQGIVNSKSHFIWVLHADSVIDDSTITAITEMARRQDKVWGRFNLALIPSTKMLQLISFLINWRSRKTKICTGDQGMFFHRSLICAIGGFPDQPLMEDIEVSKRLKSEYADLFLPAEQIIHTSGKRWLKNGYVKTILLMWSLRIRYFLGASPEILYGEYYE